MLTEDAIVKLLQEDDRAVARALVVLTARQTTDEQASEQTRHLNGRGYRPCHARMGASMSKFFERTGYLTPKQIAYWRAKDKTGSMRIGIYAGQLLEEAQRKAAQRAAAVEQSDREYIAQRQRKERQAARDYGNDMERRMVLAEQLGDVQDSDDPKIIDPIANEIDEIDAFWKRISQQKG